MTPLEIFVLFSTFITVGFLNWLADYAESQCPQAGKQDEAKDQPKIPPAQAPTQESQASPKKIKQDLHLMIHYGVSPMP